MEHDVDAAGTAPKVKTEFRHWQSLSDGFLVSLIITGPTFLFAELWRGKPMIDQGGFLWLVPGLILAIGFFVGSTIAGRHRQNPRGAFNQGLLVAALTFVLLFIADLVRRFVLGQGMELTVLGYWAAAAVATLLVGGLGGVYGRHRTIKGLKRRQNNRFF